ncbi:hypothetical protein MJO29_005170 [Puccinia striiformis f. sp. tritici]|nr:hypothetical protein MJO29_005170 [Puccinia striiformis f. sp. tritici]
MIELFAFVKALERDWQAVMRGIPIGYGTQAKLQINVAQSIGMKKPTKRQMATTNDGRPPDTSAALGLDDIQPNKVAKLGRPKNATNVDRHPQSTFVSYVASDDFKLRNRCWLVAALESLYAVYSPLWLQQSSGKKSELFHSVVSHFTNRTTYEMTNSTSVRSILTRGSKGIFEVARAINPTNFVYGEFGSLNMFIGMALDPESNSSKTLPNLFRVHESRVFSCSNHQQQIAHPRGSRGVTAIPISKLAFERNSIPMTDPARLITQWFGSGLAGTSSLACKSGNSKKAQAGPTQSHMLDQHSVLTFEGPSASAPVISVSTNTLFDFNEGTGQAMAATQPPQTTDPASGASLKIRIRLPKEAATGPNKFESNLPSLKPALLIHELQPGSLHQTTPNEPKLTHPSCQKRKAESDLQRDDEAFQPVGVQTRSKSKITRDTQPTSLASTTLTHDSGPQICIARPSNVAAALPSPSATLTHNSGSQICSAGPSTALGCSDAALFSLESTAEEKAENIAYWKRFEERQQEYALEDAQLDAIAAEFEDWNTRMEASIARTRAIRARRPRGKRPKKTMFLSGLFDPAI